jgi:hypothetical protein
VVGKTIQTFINDKLVCEYAEPPNAFRPDDKLGRLLGSGTFALQAHDPGSVAKFKDIKVKILPDDAIPPPGLVPLADRELDQLITQASNDNIPLLDLGLALPPEDEHTEEYWSDVRRHGFTTVDSYPSKDALSPPGSLLVIFDSDKGPDVGVLKAAKAAGIKVAFSSKPGTRKLDESEIRRRLQAIKAAGLDWKDFWVPGKQ